MRIVAVDPDSCVACRDCEYACAFRQSGDFARCKKLGRAMYLSKPVTQPSLRGAMIELLAESADAEHRTVGSDDPALPHYISGLTG